MIRESILIEPSGGHSRRKVFVLHIRIEQTRPELRQGCFDTPFLVRKVRFAPLSNKKPTAKLWVR